MAHLIFNGSRIQFKGETLNFGYEDFIVIGTQTWKKKNVDDDIAGSLVYNDNESNRDIYGGLYNWNLISDIETANPGWHVPSEAEFNILATYLGGLLIAGGKLKEVGTTHWDSPNTDATDEYGFTALPGGGDWGGSYDYLGYLGYFWTTDSSGENGRSKSFSSLSAAMSGYWNSKTFGMSVRLIKD